MSVGLTTKIRHERVDQAYIIWKQRLSKHYLNVLQTQTSAYIGQPLLARVDFSSEFVSISVPLIELDKKMTCQLTYKYLGHVSLSSGHFSDVIEWIQRAVFIRQKTFRDCSLCGRRTPPEELGMWNEQAACRGCLRESRTTYRQ